MNFGGLEGLLPERFHLVAVVAEERSQQVDELAHLAHHPLVELLHPQQVVLAGLVLTGMGGALSVLDRTEKLEAFAATEGVDVSEGDEAFELAEVVVDLLHFYEY